MIDKIVVYMNIKIMIYRDIGEPGAGWWCQISQISSKFSNWYQLPNLGWVSEFLKKQFFNVDIAYKFSLFL